MTHLRGTVSTRNELQGNAAYGCFKASFGEVFIAWQDDTLIWLGLPKQQRDAKMLTEELKSWAPNLDFTENNQEAETLGKKIIEAWKKGSITKYRLYGTDFQKSVWLAMLDIPFGETCSYKDIAVKIGNPAAIRAVGQAVGNNPISLLIPCHRVLPSTGGIGQYGWGSDIKKLLLDAEAGLAA